MTLLNIVQDGFLLRSGRSLAIALYFFKSVKSNAFKGVGSSSHCIGDVILIGRLSYCFAMLYIMSNRLK